MNELNIINDYLLSKQSPLMLSKQLFMKNNHISKYAEKTQLPTMLANYVEAYCSDKERKFNHFPFLTNGLKGLFVDVDKYEKNSIDIAIFVYLVFLHEPKFLKSTFNFYEQIISTNFYGIPDILIEKGIITKGTFKTYYFKQFASTLAKWYTIMEIISFQLKILEKVYHMNIDSNLLMSISENKHFSSDKGLLCAQNMLKMINKGMALISLDTYQPEFMMLHCAVDMVNGCLIQSLMTFLKRGLINTYIKSIQKVIQHQEDGVGLIGIIANIENMILNLNGVKAKIYELLDVKVACAMQQYLMNENVLPPFELSDLLVSDGISDNNAQIKSEKDIEKEMKTELKNAKIQQTWEWEEIETEDYENAKELK